MDHSWIGRSAVYALIFVVAYAAILVLRDLGILPFVDQITDAIAAMQ